MPPWKRAVRAEIKRLREFIESQPGETAAARIAYGMETALRWTTEDTVDWDLLREAKESGKIFDASRRRRKRKGSAKLEGE